MTLFEDNAAKIKELQDFAQWAAQSWINDCATNDKQVKIIEAFRTQDRQNTLFCQGRDDVELQRLQRYGLISKPQYDILIAIAQKNVGLRHQPIVTWTLASKHLQRLALDVKPINCSYDDITRLATPYGITHPIDDDQPHYQFDKCMLKPAMMLSPQAIIHRLQRAAARETEPQKTMTQKLIERITKRTNA